MKRGIGSLAAMENVWNVMGALSSVTMSMLVVLLCFVAIISILVAALGRRAADLAPARWGGMGLYSGP